jgi:outer membrane protein assembly factor BamA
VGIEARRGTVLVAGVAMALSLAGPGEAQLFPRPSQNYPLPPQAPPLTIPRDGFRPKLGGVPYEGGFALGPAYQKGGMAGGAVDLRVEGVASVRKYLLGEFTLEAPRLLSSRAFAGLNFTYRNYPEENFFGLGRDTRKEDRTTFRQEDVNVAAAAGVRPLPSLYLGGTGGLLWVNIGPGQERRVPSIEERFGASQVPGLDQQPDFYHYGGFAQYDYRQRAATPRSGGNYMFVWTRFNDREAGNFRFDRFDVLLHQYFPAFDENSSFAARALTTMTRRPGGGEIPFFLQRALGGGNDLRGFRQYRFRDNNLMLFNLEYRRDLKSFFDVVVFGDAGRVFAGRSDIGLKGMEGSGGVGFRAKFRESVLLGIDIAVSRDGFRMWFRGGRTY